MPASVIFGIISLPEIVAGVFVVIIFSQQFIKIIRIKDI